MNDTLFDKAVQKNHRKIEAAEQARKRKAEAAKKAKQRFNKAISDLPALINRMMRKSKKFEAYILEARTRGKRMVGDYIPDYDFSGVAETLARRLQQEKPLEYEKFMAAAKKRSVDPDSGYTVLTQLCIVTVQEERFGRMIQRNSLVNIDYHICIKKEAGKESVVVMEYTYDAPGYRWVELVNGWPQKVATVVQKLCSKNTLLSTLLEYRKPGVRVNNSTYFQGTFESNRSKSEPVSKTKI